MKQVLLNIIFTAQSNMAVKDAQLVTQLAVRLGDRLENPAMASQWQLLAEIARTLSLFAEAIACMHQACKLEPGNIDYRFELARDRQLSGDLVSAIEAYVALLEIAPQHCQARKNLALACLALSDAHNKDGDGGAACFFFKQYLEYAGMKSRTHALRMLTDVRTVCRLGYGTYRPMRPPLQVEIPAPTFPLDSQHLAGGRVWSPETYIAELKQAKVTGRHSYILLEDAIAASDNLVRHYRKSMLENEPGCARWRIETLHRMDGARGQVVFGRTPLHMDAAINLVGATSACYAHWIKDFLPKLWLVNQHSEYDGLPVLVDHGMPETHYELLHALNARKHRTLIRLAASDVIQCTRLIEASHLWQVPVTYRDQLSPHYADMAISPLLRDYSASLRESAVSIARPHRKLYLSRSGVRGRKLRNEAQIERIASERGYQVIHPERYGAREQVRLFAEARCIVGPAGSAFASLLFSSPGARAMLITIQHPSVNYWYFASVGQIAGVAVDFLFADMITTHELPSHSDMFLDTNKFVRALDYLESVPPVPKNATNITVSTVPE